MLCMHMTSPSRFSRLSTALLVFGCVATIAAQDKKLSKLAPLTPQPTAITEASIRGHMEFLAGDAMQGRGSGTADEWRAAAYIGSQMRRWGIEPLGDDGGYVKTVDTGRITAAAAPLLVVNGMALTHGREILVQSINKGAASGPLYRYVPGATAPEGAFVFVPDGATVDNAAIAKAAAVLTVETTQIRATWAATGSRMPAGGAAAGGRGGGAPAPATVRIVLDKATHAAMAGVADGTKLDFQCATQPGRTYNALGQLKGSDPALAAQVILLTAHLDHLGVRAGAADPIFNGADDDASGSTAVLELAQAIAIGPRPKRTVMFAWFGSEESGGFGARDFLEHPLVAKDKIVANLEFEMIGRSDPMVADKTLWLTGYERSNLGVELAKQGARLVQDPHPEQNFFSRSDNIQLARAGVIAHTVSSFNLHKDYHQASDEVKTIDFGHMTMAIQSMYAPVMWLTNSAFVPTWYENCQPVAAAPRGGGPGAAAGAPAAPTPPPCKANGKDPIK